MPYPVPIRRTALLTALALASGPAAPITTYSAPAWRQNQAAGHPIADCDALRATAARMRAGLPAQDEAIRRTEDQLAAARQGVHESTQEAQIAVVKAATAYAVHQLDTVRDLETAVENAKGASSLARRKWLARLDEFKRSAENIEKFSNSAAAGADLGAAIRDNQELLRRFIVDVDASGISDDLAMKAATFAGPMGVLTLEGLTVGRDLVYAGWSWYDMVKQEDAAARNLEEMQTARRAIDSRIYEIQGILADPDFQCATPAPPPSDRIMTQPPEPTPAVMTPVPAPAPAPRKGHGAANAAALLLIAGGAGTALYAYNKYKNTTTCTAPTGDIPSICANQSADGGTACRQILAEQVAFCQCSGYSGFDAGAGVCK